MGSEQSLSLGGAAVELAGHITEAGLGWGDERSLLGSVGEHLGDLGLLCSIAQVASGMHDIYNENKDAAFPCYSNALKTSIGYVAGKMGAELFGLASLGTLAIDMTLDEFAQTAWDGRDAKEGAATAEKYQLRIEGLVQQYVNKYVMKC